MICAILFQNIFTNQLINLNRTTGFYIIKVKKIILISPYPPAQNPRLLKEYNLLKNKGYRVKVLFAVRDKWAANTKYNIEDFILVGGSHGSLLHLFTRVVHKILKNTIPLAFIHDRSSFLLFLYSLIHEADLYIAHNLAALPIAVKAAKFHNKKCGFDAEDFHRNEVTNNENSNEYKQVSD